MRLSDEFHKVAVVLPTYNEAENLPSIADAIRRHGYRLIVVDDNSPDGTGRLADELAAADDGISVVHRPLKQGLGPAYADGFAAALGGSADVICQMDADFSHDPASLPTLIAEVGGVPTWPSAAGTFPAGPCRAGRSTGGCSHSGGTAMPHSPAHRHPGHDEWLPGVSIHGAADPRAGNL